VRGTGLKTSASRSAETWESLAASVVYAALRWIKLKTSIFGTVGHVMKKG
jgi:hypothetical protein